MKKLICLLLIVSILFSFAGCKLDLTDWLNDDTVSDFDSTKKTTPSKDNPEDTDPSETQDEDTLPSEQPTDATSPTEPSAEPPVIHDLLELRDYLNEQKEQDIFELSFIYKGVTALDAAMLAQMTSSCYIFYSYTGRQRYTVTITEYPGDRIVDAYFRNDSSSLSKDERKVLQMAIDMVEQAKAETDSPLELEILLHDMLVDHITYQDGTREISDPNDPPRHLTAVGAFLDRKANCQGYTDAFYVLGSIAGFQMGRMNVETPDDLHILNTICLDNNWYVVDVTFDDLGDGVHDYRLFNAGLDVIGQYEWAPYKEIHPIAANSSSNYYYYYYNDIVYDDLEAMAQYITEQWDDYGQTCVHTMLTGETDGMILDDVLYDMLMDTGKSFQYTFWYINVDQTIYYTVLFQ